jgi:hypothetical protein
MSARAEIRVMTRDLVDGLLSMNTSNRAIKRTVVDAYKRDIEAGNWIMTNQGIGVSCDSKLIDGQHRLTALVECGYPKVEMLIVWGLNNDAQRCVDQGAKRTMRDVLQLLFNQSLSSTVPAVCNALLRVKNGAFVYGSGGFTAAEVLRKFEENQDRILAVLSVQEIASFAAPVLAAAVLSMEESPKDEGRIIDFLKSVRDGERLTKTMPAFHLRNYLLFGSCRNRNGTQQGERFAKTRRALQAHLAGLPMNILRA